MKMEQKQNNQVAQSHDSHTSMADERVLSTAPNTGEVSNSTFKKWKKRLNPFATSLALMHKEIEDKSTRELKYLLKYGDKLNETNCWWAEYNVFPLLECAI
jgi:hypothetical protein